MWDQVPLLVEQKYNNKIITITGSMPLPVDY